MRLTIRFRPNNDYLILPINYEQVLQGFMYRSIQDFELAHFFHDVGYVKGKRRFKLFTFSRLIGPYKLNLRQKEIVFSDFITWHISSVFDPLIVDLARNYLSRGPFLLHDQPIQIEEAAIHSLDISERDSYRINMISPLTVYSTYENRYGQKRTHFFQPTDYVFSDMVEKNFFNKYYAFFGVEPSESLIIRPTNVTEKDKVITSFKKFRINAWNGTYEIKTSLNNLKFLYDTGIGSKNSQGFGMFELLNEH